MLVGVHATTNDNIYSFKEDVHYLRTLTKEKLIVCQECKAPLILKVGTVNITHFAHLNCKCSYIYHEPESENHIKGKVALKERLEKLYPNAKVYLEYKVKETNQRSDVMVIHNNGEKWAFEVQLSRISIEILIERSNLYKAAGVQDFWLLGYKYRKNSTGKIPLSIMNKIFGISIEDNIEVRNDISEKWDLIDINSIIIKRLKNKQEFLYKFEDINSCRSSIEEYNRIYKTYNQAKDAVTNQLKLKYSSSDIYNDFIIKGTKKKIDILMISKKDGSKCAFKFIYKELLKEDFSDEDEFDEYISKEDEFYKKRNIQVFWMYGFDSMFDSRSDIELNYSNIHTDKVQPYQISFEDNNWIIAASHYYDDLHIFSLDNLCITKHKFSKKYILEDINLVDAERKNKYIIYNKEINWLRLFGKWYGQVYKCPLSTLEEHDMRAENIDNCKVCRRFEGYVENTSKRKTTIRCKGLL